MKVKVSVWGYVDGLKSEVVLTGKTLADVGSKAQQWLELIPQEQRGGLNCAELTDSKGQLIGRWRPYCGVGGTKLFWSFTFGEDA